MKNCPVCHHNEAVEDKLLGVLPCLECRQRQRGDKPKESLFDFTSESIKEQRKEFDPDLIQPFRNGEVSKEYLDHYGDKHVQVTDYEKANAKELWRDLKYYD